LGVKLFSSISNWYSLPFEQVGIGSFVGWSMTAQQGLVSQIPVSFAFPSWLVVIVVIFAILSAVLSTFGPIYRLTSKSIVAIIRG
jgi:ABC-type antimicrobial peptide transport system permease subunit